MVTIPVGSHKLVTTHEAFNYFDDAYGLELEAALGASVLKKLRLLYTAANYG